MKDKEGEGESSGDPENGGGDGGGVDLCRTLAARVHKLHREEGENEEVKAYPVADGSGARHLCWMLQRGRARCTGGVAAAEIMEKDLGEGARLLRFHDVPPERAGQQLRLPVLDRADDHGVNRVERDREQHPEDGGEE